MMSTRRTSPRLKPSPPPATVSSPDFNGSRSSPLKKDQPTRASSSKELSKRPTRADPKKKTNQQDNSKSRHKYQRKAGSSENRRQQKIKSKVKRFSRNLIKKAGGKKKVKKADVIRKVTPFETNEAQTSGVELRQNESQNLNQSNETRVNPTSLSNSIQDLKHQLKKATIKFDKACRQLVVLDQHMSDLQNSYTNALDNDRKTFKIVYRMQLATLEGTHNAYIEYIERQVEKIKKLKMLLFADSTAQAATNQNNMPNEIEDDLSFSQVEILTSNFSI